MTAARDMRARLVHVARLPFRRVASTPARLVKPRVFAAVTSFEASTDFGWIASTCAKRNADGMVTTDSFLASAKAFKARWTDVMNLRYFVTANFPKINDKLPGRIVEDVLKKRPAAKFKTPGTGAVAFLYSLLKLNWFEAGELLPEPAAMLDIVKVDAFEHLGAANKPKNAEGMAELNVWQLKKSMHTCIVDVAAMVDVLVITITASFSKVRNLAGA